MKYFCCFLLTLFSLNTLISQNITAQELLDNTITYHDPNGNWPTFNGELNVTMETPKSSSQYSRILINLPKDAFKVSATKDSMTSTFIVNKDKCKLLLSDSIRIANLKEPQSRSYCESAKLYKNYYTYLYGLPMKLKDKSTIIADKVERKTFKGKTYLVLKASYDKSIGTDVWYFYFDPNTYAMEVYQFFKTDANGNEMKATGEYILLSDIETINGIKMPKIRAWYYNKDDQYLGTDTLTN